MKSIVILFLSAVFCATFAEPLKYREAQQVQSKSLVNEANVDQDTENDEEKPEQDVTEPTVYQSVPVPYPPISWLPVSGYTNGQLLVLPRENLELITFGNFETSEKTSATESQATNEQTEELETSEPKTKPLAAHKRPGPTIIIIKNKKIGELKVETNQKSTDANENTTEMGDETVEDEKSNKEDEEENDKQMTNAQVPSTQPAGYLIQLPDGSFQRIVYVVPQTRQVQTQGAFISQSNNIPFQQLQQATNSPFGYNPIINPKIITFSTQYNAK